MKDYDVMVKTQVAIDDCDGDVAMIGKGAPYEVMVGHFGRVIVVCIPTILMSVPSYINDASLSDEWKFETCPYIVYGSVSDEGRAKNFEFDRIVGEAIMTEKYFNFDAFTLGGHMNQGNVMNAVTTDLYKAVVAANRMRCIHKDMMSIDPVESVPEWTVDSDGFPTSYKGGGICERTKRPSDTNSISCNVTE